MNFDYLVVGGGLAGLTYALKVAEHGKVGVLFKNDPFQSATAWAQGGVAAVHDEDDSFDLHFEDTLKAGCFLNNQEVVRIVIEEGQQRVDELIELGVHFDKDRNGYHLHKEGGHSRRRIFHVADSTGYEIQKVLLERTKEHKNITFINNATVIDLITSKKVSNTSDNSILGIYALIEQKIVKLESKKILIATGGAGKVYLYTSNPDSATGDGIAICCRAGLKAKDMEFFQFHPTCLYHPEARTFLITEAIRGEGGILKRINGEEFMHKYHELKELAPRDIVARAIDNEMKVYGDDFVYLDIRHRGSDFIIKHFPMIYANCLKYGIDITKQMIPVVPAAHYLCGGIACGLQGETEIKGLYVAGEVACTGLHGANRLASNSLLEALVFGTRAAQHAINYKPQIEEKSLPEWNTLKARNLDEEVVINQTWEEIRRLMWNYVGIVKTNKRLERAERRIQLIEDEINEYYWDFLLTKDLIELRNIAVVARLIIDAARKQNKNIGLHYNLDNN